MNNSSNVKTSLKKPPQYDNKTLEKKLIQYLLLYYGKSFKYYNELKNGGYYFDYSQSKYSLVIRKDNSINNSKENIADIIKLHKRMGQNGIYFLRPDKFQLRKMVNEASFSKPPQNSSSKSGTLIIERNNILRDMEILNFGQYNYGKILNREISLEYIVNQYDQQTPLFHEAIDGIILPFSEGNRAKIHFIDFAKHCVIYGDKDRLLSGGLCYGNQGQGNHQFRFPFGITTGRSEYHNNTTTYPIYITDNMNKRIIKIDYLAYDDTTSNSDYDKNTYEILNNEIKYPYDVSYFESSESVEYDKLWITTSLNSKYGLICIDLDGNIVQRFKGYKNYDTGEEYYFNLQYPRISVYSDAFAALSFVDDLRNSLISCLIDGEEGTGNIYVNGNNDTLLLIHDILSFPSDHLINSVSIQKTSPETDVWPYVWVTSGFSFFFGTSYDKVHCIKMNKNANTQYLASTDLPRNGDWQRPFTNLFNTISVNNYYDIFTIEEWTNLYGIRKYLPFADIHSEQIKDYCQDSIDELIFKAVLTNDCWVKFSADRRDSATSSWVAVKIKSISGETYNSFEATISRPAGWTEGDSSLYIRIKLDLPIQDLALGGKIKLKIKLYPEYDNLTSGEYVPKEYITNIKKTCLPKPGGCPFLYVRNENQDFKVDNNLLHRSEFSPSVDITDVYKLRINPSTNGGKVEVYLIENEDDLGYIDQVKMFAVDYANDKKLAITEDNQIVLYDSASVKSSDSVMLNTTNITSNVNFHHPTSSVNGSAGDVLSAYFTYTLNPLTKNTGLELSRKNNENPENRNWENNSKKAVNENISKENRSNDTRAYEERAKRNKWTKDSFQGLQYPVAFISELRNLTNPVPAVKDTAGHLTASSVSGLIGFSSPFARRELSSVVVLPMFESPSDLVDTLEISWQSDFNIKYLGVAALDYSHYTATEMSLAEGKYITLTLDSNITTTLTSVDEEYGEVNSSALLKLKFDASQLPALGQNEKREYVIEVTGRYVSGDNASTLRVRQEVPLTYSLGQNYPNPFNPVTKINYELPRNTKVNLIIYDILGREVIKLVNNEFKEAGSYTVDFDGKNFASGVYFYRIEAGDFVQSKKMVLVK